MFARARLFIVARCALAGLCLVAAVPPWGWWPLAFVGVALLDRLLAGQSPRVRFERTFLVAAFWLYPGTVWMLDLSAPGYVLAQAIYAAIFGLVAVAVPPGRGRRLALPGAFVIAELWRWSWPFGGVPIATIPMGQVDSPLAPVVRTLGSLLLVALVVAIGVALSALAARTWHAPVIVAVVVAVALGWAAVAPDGHATRTIEVALVQGGGEQRTRANPEDNPRVFQRHLDASAQIHAPVDLVVWPENVVNPRAPYLHLAPDPRFLDYDDAAVRLRELAARLDTTLIAGWFYAIDDSHTVNYVESIASDGTALDRYDKVRTVPFGEFVPLRWLVEPFAKSVLPPRDVKPGNGPAVLDTPVGRVGIAISWEIFFDTRGRDAINNGGSILLNPTNGSSYWLTLVQTQQIASSKLRALETGRWVLQSAPTGFTAIIEPDGDVVQRTKISEQGVLQGTVELRDGKTIAARVGAWPMVILAMLFLAGGQLLARLDVHEDRDGPVVDELDEHVGAEPAGRDRGAELGEPVGHALDQRFGLLRRRGRDP